MPNVATGRARFPEGRAGGGRVKGEPGFMSSSENSALTALSELQDLEATRQAQEESARQAKERAEREAREAAEREARETAEREAREEAERLAQEEAAREAREREERIRVQEAEARAKAEADARLKEEQLRLDAKVRMEQRKAMPKWPLAVAGVLLVGVVVGGIMAKNRADEVEEANRKALAEAKAQNEAALKKQEEEFAKLQAKTAAQMDALDKRLGAAQSEAERSKLQAEKDALQAELDESENQVNKSATKVGRRRKPTSRPKKDADMVDEPEKKERKDKIKIKKTDDPLDGL